MASGNTARTLGSPRYRIRLSLRFTVSRWRKAPATDRTVKENLFQITAEIEIKTGWRRRCIGRYQTRPEAEHTALIWMFDAGIYGTRNPRIEWMGRL